MMYMTKYGWGWGETLYYPRYEYSYPTYIYIKENDVLIEKKIYPLAIYFDSYCKILEYDSEELRNAAISTLNCAIENRTICQLKNFVICGNKVNFFEVKEPF